VFYVYDFTRGQVLVSVDAGVSFAASLTGLPPRNPGWQRGVLLSSPGRLRDLWIGLPDALLHVAGIEERARTLKGVAGVDQFALGKAAAGAAYHSLYLAGRVQGAGGDERAGLFRSDDAGASFRPIDEAGRRFGAVVALAADPLEPGTVYVGTRGRGVLVGRPG
jgi:hypothetical protein